jgi:hypothetical protein
MSRFQGKENGNKNSLLYCLKVEDQEYCKETTLKDSIIDCSNENIGVCEIATGSKNIF